ncbi:MAG: tRNA (guanosine(37)-N1)-methyltransferase TrmD, partial [Chitinispirillaceae bacterium]|nr:tRNA (guanosine(37)-N1)-methyltransferase TrmD [Chitinispirillaceae bacterium]
MMFFDILTLFPSMFDGVFSDSIMHRAIKGGHISISFSNIRDFSEDERHKTVDDYPYGGDAGMLMKPEPLSRTINASKERLKKYDPKVIYLSPKGELIRHEVVDELHREKALILLCGRYKGIDERITERYVDRELSLGDFILSGGEIAAMALIDAVTRLIPGVLGNRDSAESDSFYNGLLSHPHYTRPEEFEGMRVPEVLLSGHHANIAAWQRNMALEITRKRRPDLMERYNITE